MDSLIPDNIIENLICTSCNKVLSVDPVKVYPNGDMRCGRCSKKGDGGVLSLFNQLFDQFHFKCINKFDGCLERLTHSQISKHEENCESKIYCCPICSTDFFTFLIVNHFKKKHPEAYIEVPEFIVNIEESDVEKTCLYRHEGLLFLIFFKYEVMKKNIYVNTLLLGESDLAQNITQKLLIKDVAFAVQTTNKPCDVYGSGEKDGFSIELGDSEFNGFQNTVKVQLKIDLPCASEEKKSASRHKVSDLLSDVTVSQKMQSCIHKYHKTTKWKTSFTEKDSIYYYQPCEMRISGISYSFHGLMTDVTKVFM
ncbi:hypothetical protein JTB14_013467 [Gonioctena quinquepunctata]|nr:hypothetical protein JTB14_013467 [Gonioctena quinquepunctata]